MDAAAWAEALSCREWRSASASRQAGLRPTVVVGNPKPASRTLEAATSLARAFSGSPPDDVFDLVELGPALLGWGDHAVAEAVRTVQSSSLAVFASPTFKGSCTGLLKLFLDQFAGGTGLAGWSRCR